jgi:hypothetical protein
MDPQYLYRKALVNTHAATVNGFNVPRQARVPSEPITDLSLQHPCQSAAPNPKRNTNNVLALRNDHIVEDVSIVSRTPRF